MPQVELKNATFARLQRNAQPLIDTIDTVVNRALDALEQRESEEATVRPSEMAAVRKIDLRQMPNLKHTKVLAASVAGRPLPKVNWNGLLDHMLRLAHDKLGSFAELRRLCPINMVEGRKEEHGYGYLDDIGISVQGQDSNSACRSVAAIAQGLGVALEIEFMWRHKDGAAYPGERGRITIPGAVSETAGQAA